MSVDRFSAEGCPKYTRLYFTTANIGAMKIKFVAKCIVLPSYKGRMPKRGRDNAVKMEKSFLKI